MQSSAWQLPGPGPGGSVPPGSSWWGPRRGPAGDHKQSSFNGHQKTLKTFVTVIQPSQHPGLHTWGSIARDLLFGFSVK